VLGQAERSVADVHVDALVTGRGEALTGQLGELRDSLDRVDLGG